ncbi:hypothetical protein DMENIID0001_140680 [Sergentomyia squamirostris]
MWMGLCKNVLCGTEMKAAPQSVDGAKQQTLWVSVRDRPAVDGGWSEERAFNLLPHMCELCAFSKLTPCNFMFLTHHNPIPRLNLVFENTQRQERNSTSPAETFTEIGLL